MAVKLGDLCRDVITGFKGIAVAKTEFLYSCARIALQPEELDKDGKVQDALHFDEQQVEVIEPRKPAIASTYKELPKAAKTRPGGPGKAVSRRPDVLR